MPINPEIFRGYDIRGREGIDLNEDIVEQIAKAYATWLTSRGIKEVVIGYDSRETSLAYTQAAIKGLVGCGIHIVNIGMVLTQMVYWAQYFFKSKGAVMITASHNPKGENGLKLGADFSLTVLREQVQEIRELAEKGEFVAGVGSVREENIFAPYLEDLLKRVKVNRKFKIAFDTANGTPGLFVKKVFEPAGVEVLEFNTKLDGSMPLGTPDPTAEPFLQRLAKETVESGADMGIAYDTDGDRFGFVDEKGNMIWNDVLVAIFAKDILSRNPGAKIIYNTLCSKVVKETIQTYGGVDIMWLTGHSYIAEKVREENSPFGGELSGHMFFRDNFYGHEDGFYTTLRFLEILSQTDKTVSEVVADLPHYISSPETKVGAADALKVQLVEALTKELKKLYPEGEFATRDGVRVDFPEGMMVVRASQNGPYLAIKVEAKTQARYDELRHALGQLLRSHPEVDWSKAINVEVLAP